MPAEILHQEVTYVEAIRLATLEAMRVDPSVICIGQDIGVFGGAFKATKGLLEEFGPDRVLDMPIAEAGMVSLGIGAAMCGMRPIIEIQFADFVTNAFTQVVYNAAMAHFRLGQSVPLVMRLPSGGGLSAGPFHSTNPEAWFCHTPGLIVVAPASVQDAYWLLRASIENNNPVIFLEHKWLYRRDKGEILNNPTEIGRARIVKESSRATVVTYGAMVHRTLETELDVEIIDLRTLLPWDKQTVYKSIRKTGRVLVLHEAQRTGGFGGEIAASIAEDCFEYLDAPVARLAAHDTPVPFSKPLEDFFLPGVASIATALKSLLEY